MTASPLPFAAAGLPASSTPAGRAAWPPSSLSLKAHLWLGGEGRIFLLHQIRGWKAECSSAGLSKATTFSLLPRKDLRVEILEEHF